ncbi:prepilin peptidase [Hirschia baltica]|uniref:prepilin peptidase n=1 Tax=Hirschia baltica TaxID=2724 RepID=UPI0002DE9A3D|nr:A24 family peptidase [Hirschia baltica]
MDERLKLKSNIRYILCASVALFAMLTALVCLPLEFFYPSIFIAIFLSWMSFVDIERHILPNLLTYTLLIAGLVWASVFKLEDLHHHVIGCAVGYGLIVGVSYLHKVRKGVAGMGMGDAKLLAAAGAWSGWVALPYILLIAAVSGLVLVGLKSLKQRQIRGDVRIAFGPHLAFGFWVVWLLGPSIKM